jgi:hypothetical protein
LSNFVSTCIAVPPATSETSALTVALLAAVTVRVAEALLLL